MGRRIAVTFILAVVFFYLGDRLGGFVAAELSAQAAPGEILPRFPAHLAASPFRMDMSEVALMVGAVLAGIVVLSGMYQMSKKTNRRPGEEHGSAAWADAREIRKLGGAPAHARLQLTKTEAMPINTRKTHRNLNIAVIGASGTGKTRGYLLPNLSTVQDMSFGITDPKSEIYRATRWELVDRGYQVRCLDLVDLKNSCQFNPYTYFSKTEPETSVVQLAQTIIQNTTGQKPANADQFWERAEKALLTALIAYEYAMAVIEGRDATLPGVLDLQRGMDQVIEEAVPADPENETDAKPEVILTDSQFAEAAELVKAAQEAGDVSTHLKVLDFACRQYAIYKQGPEITRRSIMICLGVRLTPLDMHDIRHIFSGDTVNLGGLGETPTAIFLCLPDTHDTFRFVSSMFWQSLFAHNVYLADHHETGALPVPVHCFLDEFANIGVIPNFERLIATIRSRNISVSVIVQAFSQGKAVWRENWATIIGNCDSVLFLGGRDEDTNQWLSKQLGSETLHVEENSQSYGMQGSRTRQQRSMKRDLLTPDEIGRMPNDEALLLIRGLRPFRSKKADNR